jgi:pyruvate kinase
MKKTKIIATIGPASEQTPTLVEMIEAGMNVARLNFSHGSYENHTMLMKNVRAAASKVGTTVAILQDLQGPKIRVGNLKKPFPIKPGQKVTIGQDFPLDFDISFFIKKGNRILIEDGLIELKVLSVKGKKNSVRGS